jgi:hypothetical protein
VATLAASPGREPATSHALSRFISPLISEE